LLRLAADTEAMAGMATRIIVTVVIMAVITVVMATGAGTTVIIADTVIIAGTVIGAAATVR
jgi:hypothetical protein